MSGWRAMRIHSFTAVLALIVLLSAPAISAAAQPVLSLVHKEKSALLDTLRELVSIESGSRDIEGLDRIADVIAARLIQLGGKIELIEPNPRATKLIPKLGKMVQATFRGSGTRKILLLAHMDTVYARGMLEKQPFRLERDQAWGLGIADNRHGIAVIIHTIAVLKAMGFSEYGEITVLLTGDEEVGSPGSRSALTRLGAEHDVVMSFDASSMTDRLALATSAPAGAILTVTGRAAHAGVRPEAGVNALYELAHQILQMRNLSDASRGVKVNWTMARAGLVRNMIPPGAQAEADVRVERVSDYDVVERAMRERIKNKLLPESEVTLDFRRGRPPLQATDASRALGAHAQKIYAEIGRNLIISDVPSGGATDAAYAALKTKAPVIEGFGLLGYGAHSTDAEYVLVDSIEPRLYLAVRMIIDIAQGNAPLSAHP